MSWFNQSCRSGNSRSSRQTRESNHDARKLLPQPNDSEACRSWKPPFASRYLTLLWSSQPFSIQTSLDAEYTSRRMFPYQVPGAQHMNEHSMIQDKPSSPDICYWRAFPATRCVRAWAEFSGLALLAPTSRSTSRRVRAIAAAALVLRLLQPSGRPHSILH